MKYIKCNKCGIKKPRTNKFFNKKKSNKDGLRNECKKCQSEYLKAWRKDNPNYGKNYREANKEEIAKYQKQYDRQYYQENKARLSKAGKEHYRENKEQYAENHRQWVKNNKEKREQYMDKWIEQNKEHVRAYSKRYREENKDYLRELNRKWRQENRHIDAAYSKDRAQRIDNLPFTLTIEEWIDTLLFFDYECAYCQIHQQEHLDMTGESLQQDHVIPLSEGGAYTKCNIIPACRKCNSSKGSKCFLDWFRRHEQYSQSREDKITEFIIENKEE